MVDVVVTNKAIDGRALGGSRAGGGSRGVFLRRDHSRRARTIGVVPDTKVHRGDVLTIVGATASLTRAIEYLGVADRVTDVTDMLVVAVAIVAGALIGLPALRHRRRRDRAQPAGRRAARRTRLRLAAVRAPGLFGRIPGADAVGVRVHRAHGIRRGGRPQCRAGLRRGPAGERRRASSSPARSRSRRLLVGVLVGRWVFKMHPGVLLGVCAGACTATPALAAIQETAKQRRSVDRLRRGLRRRQRVPGHLGDGDRGADGLTDAAAHRR